MRIIPKNIAIGASPISKKNGKRLDNLQESQKQLGAKIEQLDDLPEKKSNVGN